MCTKKELVEWLEANLSDNTPIWVFDREVGHYGRYVDLALGNKRLFEYVIVSEGCSPRLPPRLMIG